MQLCYNANFSHFFFEVGFDEEAATSITDANGFINRENFIRSAKDIIIVDFGEKKDEIPN